MSFRQALAILLLAATPAIGDAADWRYAVGVHDFVVPDVDSHTYGINGRVSAEQRFDTGRRVFASFDLFWDRDKDHLDPDHIPIWWQLHVGTDGDFWRESRMRLGWTADFNTRINTASSIERQITALPALAAGYDGRYFQASLEGGAGWFFLEIDDDAPRAQGYGREGLRNSTLAYALTAKARVKLGESWALSGFARHWQDGSQALQNQYRVELRGDVSRWIGGGPMKNPELVLSADAYRYNLNVYNRAGLPPVLRWDDDVTFRVLLETRW